ncbi:MAG TPA: N-6 DNA methylase [Steroidobacteraceae bacterium]|nr:N-6 DNA methylase [Steroidobacteraceae bacterium]
MNIKMADQWKRDFALHERADFFGGKEHLKPSTPQAHVVRRAFDLLQVDGVLCGPSSPLIYFKQVSVISAEEVFALHRKFWNHGGAPILVLISPDRIHIYSGMSKPAPVEACGDLPSLVKTLERASKALQEFLASVESGEFFGKHAAFFNPEHRVDRDLLNNLNATREVLAEITKREIAPQILDALLCRLVFTCYLFDREVIGHTYLNRIAPRPAKHLRDVLAIQPVTDAKVSLYRLFKRLGRDFNGDLFSDDLDDEIKLITNAHIQVLSDFFHGTLVRSGQMSFWPYDFAAIPIETISAIYEHFLKLSERQTGAFYTPRFLAEIVLDTALDNFGSLLGKKFLDPACGSGIFLVGLFNRLAEEWRQRNPTAKNDRQARELMNVMQASIFGVDIDPTACRITAFSLYLAYLDQLEPRDIQALQERGRILPNLVAAASSSGSANIRCGDFFLDRSYVVRDADLVIGNPPWGSIAGPETLAGKWCHETRKPLPDKQMAAAFVWKAADHTSETGRVCLVLPHGVLFNHSNTASAFQSAWLSQRSIRNVLNLADLRWFLFDKAVHPALVVSYAKNPSKPGDVIEYWAPKGDWNATQVEVISISEIDRTEIAVETILKDLEGPDSPQVLKQRFWGTPRDLRLLEKLFLYPRLRDHVRKSQETGEKAFVMAEGFQPLGANDDEGRAKTIKLPSRYFIPATSPDIDLFLLADDCKVLSKSSVAVRNRSNKNTDIFRGPHVLITKGFERIAFADFDVSFQHALRGIHGSREHRDLLVFLAAYLRTSLAKYFMFHTSASLGMYRPEGHVEEVLRLPFPFPEQQEDANRCKKIIQEVSQVVLRAAERAKGMALGRAQVVAKASETVEPLIEEYFNIQPLERLLIADTINITIPSVQPRQARMPVPTVRPASGKQREAYKNRVCEMLSKWTRGKPYTIRGTTVAADTLGTGMMVLEKSPNSRPADAAPDVPTDVLSALFHIRRIASRSSGGTLDLVRGTMVFDENRLYVVKPVGQRYWTQTAALNDADEIAGTILMQSLRERA